MRQAPAYFHGCLHGVHAALPRRVEHRLVLLGLDLAEPVYAAHVVDTVHHVTSLGDSAVGINVVQPRCRAA